MFLTLRINLTADRFLVKFYSTGSYSSIVSYCCEYSFAILTCIYLMCFYLGVRGRVIRCQLDGGDVQFEPWRLLPLQAAVPAARLIHARCLSLRLPACQHTQRNGFVGHFTQSKYAHRCTTFPTKTDQLC